MRTRSLHSNSFQFPGPGTVSVTDRHWTDIQTSSSKGWGRCYTIYCRCQLLMSTVDVNSWCQLLMSSVDVAYWCQLLMLPFDVDCLCRLLLMSTDVNYWWQLLMSTVDANYRLSTVYCLLSTVYCILFLFTVYCLPSTVYRLLFTVYCLPSTIYVYFFPFCHFLSLLDTFCPIGHFFHFCHFCHFCHSCHFLLSIVFYLLSTVYCLLGIFSSSTSQRPKLITKADFLKSII